VAARWPKRRIDSARLAAPTMTCTSGATPRRGAGPPARRRRRDPRLEDLARGRIDRLGVLPVFFVQLENVSGVEPENRSSVILGFPVTSYASARSEA
jgi:hypothetical protein